MLLKNNMIYQYAEQLMALFQNSDQKFPIKINFYLQKNINTLTEAAREIEQARIAIIQEYGIINPEDNTYKIPAENVEKAQSELSDLLNLEQDIPLHLFSINDFENVEPLTYQQMSALMFMIVDDED